MNILKLKSLLRSRAGLDQAELTELEQEAARTETTLEQVVVRRGVLPQDKLYEMMAKELNVPYVDVSSYAIEPELLTLVPAEIARKHKLLPLFRIGTTLSVAMSSPDDITALDELRQTLGMQISPVLAVPQALDSALEHYYQTQDTVSVDAIALEAAQAVQSIESELDSRTLEELASEAPVVRLVNALLKRAVSDRASDIHIEPDEGIMRVRLRVDGLVKEIDQFSEHLHPAVASRIKILASLDISEKRRPQDGRFEARVDSHLLDIRVSTFPTVYGENVVLRLLDKSSGPLGIAELAMAKEVTARFETLIRQPHGIILVTGPTGSGKTTTLYAVLNAISTLEKNIITLEDPVEYRLPLVRHCQVNPKAGVSFASGLRSVLRQDPDIVMVGEIRDSETAKIAFQAALTGHLVLSTLHTNDAASALTRMADMKIEPFLISSSVIAILAQRLARRVCKHCRQSFVPLEAVLRRLDIPADTAFVHGTGCPACSNSGYLGRLGVFELLPMTTAVRKMVMEQKSSEEIKAQALTEGMITLRQDAITKARAGLITPEEVLRVTQDYNA